MQIPSKVFFMECLCPTIDTDQSLDSISTLKSHYFILPNPGDSFVSVKAVLSEFKLFMEINVERVQAILISLWLLCHFILV